MNKPLNCACTPRRVLLLLLLYSSATVFQFSRVFAVVLPLQWKGGGKAAYAKRVFIVGGLRAVVSSRFYFNKLIIIIIIIIRAKKITLDSENVVEATIPHEAAAAEAADREKPREMKLAAASDKN